MAGEHPGPGLKDFQLAFQCPASDSWNLTATQVFSTIWHQYLLGKHQFSNLSTHLIDKLTMMLNNAHYLQTIPLHTIQGEFMAHYKEFKRKHCMANADSHPGMADRQAAKTVLRHRNGCIHTVCNVRPWVASTDDCFNSCMISITRHVTPRSPLISIWSVYVCWVLVGPAKMRATRKQHVGSHTEAALSGGSSALHAGLHGSLHSCIT